jgi:hypothetical protein
MKFEDPINLKQGNPVSPDKDPVSEQEDFNNEEVSTRIFESGTPEELARLKSFFNLTDNQMELFSYYMKLRRKTINEMQALVAKREVENPRATEAEMSMGSYVERIEPQVRSAVLSLRAKGYRTYESGFHGGITQLISFEEDQLKEYTPSDDLVVAFEEYEVSLEVESNSIIFQLSKKLDLPTLTKLWDMVVADLPDIGEAAAPCELSASTDFRERQEKLKIK